VRVNLGWRNQLCVYLGAADAGAWAADWRTLRNHWEVSYLCTSSQARGDTENTVNKEEAGLVWIISGFKDSLCLLCGEGQGRAKSRNHRLHLGDMAVVSGVRKREGGEGRKER
jgi:hypothetical protein